MATETQRQRLRMDLGLEPDDIVGLSDAKADLWYEEAGESYTDAASINAATRVIAIKRLLVQSASDVDYTQNNTQEKASQRFAHLSKILADWQKELDDVVVATGSGAARFGRSKRLPARIKEYPNGGWGHWGW